MQRPEPLKASDFSSVALAAGLCLLWMALSVFIWRYEICVANGGSESSCAQHQVNQ